MQLKPLSKLLLVMATTWISTSYADQNIEIVGGNSAGNPKLAIVNFTNDNGAISDEVSNDFKITGEFNVSNYASTAEVGSNAQYTISGSITTDAATGQSQVNYQLLNNSTKKVLLNQTASFNSLYLRKAIHTIDNNIYTKLTNNPGAFTSKLALAVKSGDHYSIVISDYDGYNPKTIISTAHPLTSLAWDKSGHYLSYVSYETGKPVVYTQNLQTGARYAAANFNGSNSSPAFAPDTSKLAVTLSKDYGSHIYLVNNQRYNRASGALPLVNFGTIDTEADIANTGKMVFTSDHDGGPQIFMSDLNGATPARVTHGLGNFNTTARFANDGSKITFINRNNGVLQAYVLDLVTQAAYPISPNGHHDISPSFAPNDRLIVFSSDDGVYISNITGTVLTRLNNLNFDQIIDQRWGRNL